MKQKRTINWEFVKILILRTIGNFLILFSFFIIVKTFYQPVKQEIRYFIEKRFAKKYIVNRSLCREQRCLFPTITPKPAKNLLSSILKIKEVEILTPEDLNFSIVIPKIAANARVFSNVEAGDEKEYLEVLRKGVAHAKGSFFPGERGHIFLFAHSTDYFWNMGSYNAVFYLLSKLEIGDEINLFYKNQRFIYRTVGKKIIDSSQVEYLTRETDQEFLTLQTCWPPGTTLKRLLVFAERAVE